jgi:hypothetical protein
MLQFSLIELLTNYPCFSTIFLLGCFTFKSINILTYFGVGCGPHICDWSRLQLPSLRPYAYAFDSFLCLLVRRKFHCLHVQVILRSTVSRPVLLVSCLFWSGWPDLFEWQLLFLFFHVGRPLRREYGSVICSAITQVEFQVILRPKVSRPVRLGAGPPMGPMTRF